MSPIGEQQRLVAGPAKTASWSSSSRGNRPSSSHHSKKSDRPAKDYSYMPALQTAEVQNVRSHKIFVFGSEDDDVIDIENGSIEMTEIRSRGRTEYGNRAWGGGRNQAKDDVRKNHYIDHTLEPDDTLAKLSLKFGCTVTQIKQANGIYNDQELYARKALKIPVFQHSVLWEVSGNRKNSLDSKIDKLKEITRSQSEGNLRHVRENMMYERDRLLKTPVSPTADYSYSDDECRDGEARSLLSGLSRNSNSLNDTNNLYEEYLELVDKDIQDISNRVQSKSDVIDVGAHSIAYMQPNTANCKNDQKLGNAGWISYKGILIVVCTVAVLLPVMYILYFMVFKKKR